MKVIMMCHFTFISCNKCTILIGDVDHKSGERERERVSSTEKISKDFDQKIQKRNNAMTS